MSAFTVVFISILFGAIANYLFRFYSRIKTYPSGPLPLPLFGNLLTLIRNRKRNAYLVMDECCKKYGKVSTFWIGSKPVVIIFDIEVAKYAFNKAECCGRPFNAYPIFGFNVFGVDDNTSDEQQTLRKLSIGSIRNLLSTNKICSLINESVTELIIEIKSKENNRAFKPELYMPHIMSRTMCELVFGQQYSFGDKQLQTVHHSLDAINHEIMIFTLIDFVPISKYFIKVNQTNLSTISELNVYHKQSFERCKSEYKSGMCDNFTNALLTARIKMIGEGNDCAEHLTDENILSLLMSLLLAGNETSKSMLHWIILMISHYTEIQDKLREEVNNVLGEKSPNMEDRKNFHYLNAFIFEVLRFAAILPFGMLHKTLTDFNICDYTLPKDTIVMTNLYAILNDPLYWKQPEKFMPERFLDSNRLFISSSFPALVAFSVGKRKCVGERFAEEMLFLALVCLLQSTNGYRFVLENGQQNQDLLFDTKASATFQPKPYKIILKSI